MQEEEDERKFRTPEQVDEDMNRLYYRFMDMTFPGTLPITWCFLRPKYTKEEKEALKSFKRETWLKTSLGTGLFANALYYFHTKTIKGGGFYFFRHIGLTLASVYLAYLSTQVKLQGKVVELFPDGVAAWQVLNSRGYINPDTGKIFTPEETDLFLFGKSFRDEKSPENAIANYIFGWDVAPNQEPKKPTNTESPEDISDCAVDLDPYKSTNKPS